MEKMKVLQMLEEGKITADEAANLLQAIDGSRKTAAAPTAPAGSRTHYGTGAGSSGSTGAAGYPGRSRDPRQNAPYSGVSGDSSARDIAGEFSRKIETLAKDMEPKIARFTEAVVERTANVADKISRSLTETAAEPRSTYEPRPAAPTPPRQAAGAASAPSPTAGALVERNFELVVRHEYNELNLTAFNGDVLVKGYNGDKITARVLWKARKRDANIELMKFGNKFYLNYDEDEFEKVIIDAYIPEAMFNRVSIRTINGRIDISTVKCDYMTVATANGETVVRDVEAGDIRVENDNARTTVAGISGNTGYIENFNGALQADMLDISDLAIVCSNTAINMNIAAFERHTGYSWKIETNNGKLGLNLPTHPTIGYDIKARNTLGSIKIGLTGLNYTLNSSSAAEARSIDYESAFRKIDLNMETSNAALIVN